jgi:hypothetical protein
MIEKGTSGSTNHAGMKVSFDRMLLAYHKVNQPLLGRACLKPIFGQVSLKCVMAMDFRITLEVSICLSRIFGEYSILIAQVARVYAPKILRNADEPW